MFRKEQPREQDFLTKEVKERKSRNRYCEIDRKEVKKEEERFMEREKAKESTLERESSKKVLKERSERERERYRFFFIFF